jgi:hypothetical protein
MHPDCAHAGSLKLATGAVDCAALTLTSARAYAVAACVMSAYATIYFLLSSPTC